MASNDRSEVVVAVNQYHDIIILRRLEGSMLARTDLPLSIFQS